MERLPKREGLSYKDKGERKKKDDRSTGFIRELQTKQFFKFVLVGGINTTIHMGLLFIFVHFFSVWYLLASFLAFLVAVTNSFILNNLWIFKKEILEKTTLRFSKFYTISSVTAILNLTFLYIFTEFFGIWYLVSQFLAIVMTLMINFKVNRLWTYN